MNSPRRSTSDSLGDSPALMPATDRAASPIPTIQPTEKNAQTTSRGPVGRKALTRITTTATTIPLT